MTKVTCPECGQWDYTGNNTKGQKATCPKCTRKVTIPVIMFAALILASAVFGTVYAYTEDIDLPRGDYISKFCEIQIYAFPQWFYNCTFGYVEQWNFENDPVLPEAVIIRPTTNIGDPTGNLIEQFEEFVKQITNDQPDEEPDTKTKPDGNLGIDEEIAIEKLDECLRGFERYASWGAFQQSGAIDKYENKTRYEYNIRDNLNQTPVLAILKAIEECNAIKYYVEINMIGPEQANKANADRLGVDYLGRHQTENVGNAASLGFQLEKEVNDEKIAKTQRDAQEFMCSTEGKQRGLCSFEFTGINKGGYTGVDPMGIYADYVSALEQRDITENTKAKIQANLDRQVCEIAFKTSGYGAISVKGWRMFLSGGWCDDKLSSNYIKDMTNGKFSSLKDVRDYRNSLDATIKYDLENRGHK